VSNKDTWYCKELKVKIPPVDIIAGFFEDHCFEDITDIIESHPDNVKDYPDDDEGYPDEDYPDEDYPDDEGYPDEDYPDNDEGYSWEKTIRIKYSDINIFSRGLGKALLNNFYATTEVLRAALAKVRVIKGSNKKINFNEIEFRITDIPNYLKTSIRELGQRDIGKLVYLDGLVKSVSEKRSKITIAAFQCLRCGHVTLVEQNSSKLEEPFAGCENETCGKKGPFKLITVDSTFEDFQELQLQESPDLARGTKIRDITVFCYRDLVNQAEPGEKITVTGILETKQISDRNEKTTLYETLIEAVSIQKKYIGFDEYVFSEKDEAEILELSQDPEITDKIVKSIAPSIHGNEIIKEALTLQLFSGVKKELPDKTQLRGNIHVALIGDPGTAKSLLLRKIVKLSHRGVFTSGKMASAAGLTAAAVKDASGTWTLEGGAAVMASGGLLAVDEIGQADPDDISALHEVMEQGTVSLSKAGNVATIRADCAVLAAGNPETGYFNIMKPISEQIKLPPALWSRFDLIFIVQDKPDPKNDRDISDQILQNHLIGAMIQNQKNSKNPKYIDFEVEESKKCIEAPIPEETLRKYIAYARTHVFPVADPEVQQYMQSFYLNIRSLKELEQNSPVPITARSLEALQRLAEARARTRLSDSISIDDVNFAKHLMSESLKQVSFDVETGKLDAGIITSGVSQSQAEKTTWLREILKGKCTEQEAISQMKSRHNVDEEKTVGLIKKLSENGKVYLKTSDGTLRFADP
jgi:Predicted ATPase involved in replication control, Cdc46/Mcm family